MTRPLVGIDFFADVVCPWCYVAWAALKSAAERQREALGVKLVWRTFLLNPDTPPDGLDRPAVLASMFAGAPDKAAASKAALESAAAAAKTPLNLDAATRIPNTAHAHRLIHWAAQAGAAEAVIDAIFQAYFVAGADIGDIGVLSDLGDQAGLDAAASIRTRLESGEDRELMLRLHAAAAQIGVQGVPMAILNRKVPIMGAESPAVYAAALLKAVS